MNVERFQFWVVVVMAACAALMVGLAGWALTATDPTGLGRAACAVAGVANLVATAVGALAVHGRLTGSGAVDEEVARFGIPLCLISGTLLPNAATIVDEPDWRLLFFGFGTVIALAGVAMAAVAPRAVRAWLGLEAGWPN